MVALVCRNNKSTRYAAPLQSLKHQFQSYLFAQWYAPKRGRKRPETIYFLGFTLYCTRNRQGNFKVGYRTEKSRLLRSIAHLTDLMRRQRHLPVREQALNLSRVLRGHYAYYGIAGNLRALQKVQRFVERYWRKMLSSRGRAGYVTWRLSIGSRRVIRYRPRSWLSPMERSSDVRCCESPLEERRAGNPHAAFCGSRRWVTASGDPVGVETE